MNSSVGIFNDEILGVDTSIQVFITASRYGGTTYLDNFDFEGRLGLTDCTNIATGTLADATCPDLSVYRVPASSQWGIECKAVLPAEGKATLYNFRGNQ